MSSKEQMDIVIHSLIVDKGFIMDKISGNISGLTQQKIIFEDPKSSSMLELFFMYKLSAPRNFFLSISYDEIFNCLSLNLIPFIIALDIFPNPINPISDIDILYTLSGSKNFCPYPHNCRTLL